ncbi:MAG: PEGA domain-containing protein, partial [Haliea sp.]
MTASADRSDTITPSAFQPLDSAAAPPSAGGPNWRRWLVPGAVLLFALAMLFLFAARSVEISVESTERADVSLDGLYLPFGGRYLMRPGDYALSISAPGYEPLATTLTVTGDDSQRFNFSLQPRPGRISLRSQPSGAAVSLDGERVGETPMEALELAAGEYRLAFSHPRYLPATTTFTVSGRDRAETLEQLLEPAWANIGISSEPAGAEILVDGEAVGITPATVELLQGERQLLLQLPGFASWQQALTITAGEDTALDTVQLLPAAGILELS